MELENFEFGIYLESRTVDGVSRGSLLFPNRSTKECSPNGHAFYEGVATSCTPPAHFDKSSRTYALLCFKPRLQVPWLTFIVFRI